MIAILDYDAGNIKSVEKAFGILGEETILTRDFRVIEKADRLVLPGVGSFADAMSHLKKYELDKAIKDYVKSGKPFIGICLGLQLLFESSEESPGVEGLHLLDGVVKRIPDGPGVKVPHIGWNSLDFPNKGKLFEGIDEGSFVYFVHSYYLEAADPSIVKATTDYGCHIHASVEKDNIFACQFHPEKSSTVGLQILKNFARL
ncbi:imidazole glycerol phosphate synthase subunit HisH [Pseudobutyrivibrio xylanivorans]|uniref:Imidazole glycerol phosphate synthase subunit HisH n=1 Tax=Pseudobutyrivibrio xylanivorans DSM 14809 TaxID=1123012 RepID=A0A1M6BT49_PSEXY|nr:imidazole glycerol phosphate synthase subunit HisH [Pseudobutyrivibrio xylanivorans]SHI51774.1 glutamine amidotransferase [Pseudobutyrivibrio xylanivorans DSM 14809]